KLEGFLAQLPDAARHAAPALLATPAADALVRHPPRFASLTPAARVALIDRWRHGGLARRSAMRALITPLKVAHFDDPAFYRHLGCVYELQRPAPEAKPAWFRDRVHGAADCDGDLALDCDVVVVGTGAGGAVVAKELAEAGVAVVMLEEGRYFDRSEFNGRPFEMQRAMYRAGGATFAVGNVPIPIPIGQTVGGTTTVNSGTCYRVPDRVLAHWRDDLGLAELTPDALAPHFDKVERILGVADARPEFLGGNARVIQRGCDALGYAHRPLRRNAPDCDGQGVCCFGCPTDAKRSTNVSYVPMALRAGAELFHGARVERVIVAGGRATGVVARVRGADGGSHRVTVHARAVVLACGTLMTPGLLEANGLGGASGELGGNLSIHPACGALAEFDERIAGWDGIPQGYSIDEFHDEGILFEGAATPLEYTVSLMPQVGARLVELAEGFDRVASFGFLVADTSRGRVRQVGGRPVITYVLNDHDVARLKRGVDILARVFFAAGARAVLTPVHGFDELRSAADLDRFRATRVRASQLELSAYHPLGTCRMGVDPARSVVGADHQLHDCAGLYVVDGSAVPSSLGVNPQVTIMALATRAAQLIAARLA
ncbi:MAG: GMC family oxidoreductase, partial [Myxococcales bacterium]|nr:GMC family oxidoreductase [Myxococcales bacterium]